MTTNHTNLIKQCRRVDRHGYPSCYSCYEAADALEAMQADAVRYRWLRDFDSVRERHWVDWSMEADEIDAAIDAAIAAGAQK